MTLWLSFEMIAACIEEQYTDEDGFKDYIDIAIENADKQVCPYCRAVSDKLNEVCLSCLGNNSFFDEGFDKYHRTESQHRERIQLSIKPSPALSIQLLIKTWNIF